MGQLYFDASALRFLARDHNPKRGGLVYLRVDELLHMGLVHIVYELLLVLGSQKAESVVEHLRLHDFLLVYAIRYVHGLLRGLLGVDQQVAAVL